MSANGDIYTDANGQVQGPSGIISSQQDNRPPKPYTDPVEQYGNDRTKWPKPEQDSVEQIENILRECFPQNGMVLMYGTAVAKLQQLMVEAKTEAAMATICPQCGATEAWHFLNPNNHRNAHLTRPTEEKQ